MEQKMSKCSRTLSQLSGTKNPIGITKISLCSQLCLVTLLLLGGHRVILDWHPAIRTMFKKPVQWPDTVPISILIPCSGSCASKWSQKRWKLRRICWEPLGHCAPGGSLLHPHAYQVFFEGLLTMALWSSTCTTTSSHCSSSIQGAEAGGRFDPPPSLKFKEITRNYKTHKHYQTYKL